MAVNGNRHGIFHSLAAAVLVFVLLLAACGLAPLPTTTVRGSVGADGVHEGRFSSWPNSATVRASVKEGRIIDIAVVSHVASWIGKKAEAVIPDRIIKAQSTRADAVSGATNSSRVIMNAVQNALDKTASSSADP